MKTQEYPVITLHGTRYEVTIIDATHCAFREAGYNGRWGIAQHIAQITPDMETQIFEAGRIVDGHFTL